MAELQIFPMLSHDAVSTEAPSGENSAEVMTASCPASVRRHSPIAELQIFAVPPQSPRESAATNRRLPRKRRPQTDHR